MKLEYTKEMLSLMWNSLGGCPTLTESVRFIGTGNLQSVFAVTDFAAASMGAASLAVSELVQKVHGKRPFVTVDRRMASLWFAKSIRPEGWNLASLWDPLSGNYEGQDGWIRLHMNAPHHKLAALTILGEPADRELVARAVKLWPVDDLESAIVENGGCAAAMWSAAAWSVHPQGNRLAGEPLLVHSPGSRGRHSLDQVSRARPLNGVRVLDMTRILAGPVATRFLAGYGADVLRIDPPHWEEDSVAPEITLGKRCARLNLRDAKDRHTWETLLSKADVLVHGYRPGAMEALGLDATERASICPGLIDVSLNAYGWVGPWQTRRGFDSLVQMSCGIAEAGMAGTGRDVPTPLPVQALDHATGYLMAAAVVRGITERIESRLGCEVKASLTSTAALLTQFPAREGATPLEPENPENFSEQEESTPWGKAHRLKPAVTIDGSPKLWELPACELGSGAPAWRS